MVAPGLQAEPKKGTRTVNMSKPLTIDRRDLKRKPKATPTPKPTPRPVLRRAVRKVSATYL